MQGVIASWLRCDASGKCVISKIKPVPGKKGIFLVGSDEIGVNSIVANDEYTLIYNDYVGTMG